MPGRPAAVTAGTCLAIVLGVLSVRSTVDVPAARGRATSSMRGRDRHHGAHVAHPARGRHRPVRRQPPCTRAARRIGMDGARRPSPGSTGHASISPRAGVRPSTPRSWRWTVTKAVDSGPWATRGRPARCGRWSCARSPSGGWREVDTPRRRAGATLTDVGSDGTAGTWAVGYAIGKPGRHAPWALRWTGGRFVDRSPGLASGEHGRLTAVSVSTSRRHLDRGLRRPGRDRPSLHRPMDRRRLAAPGPAGRRGGRHRGHRRAIGRGRVGRRVSPDRDRVSSRSCCAGTGRAGQTADTSALADGPALLMATWTAVGGVRPWSVPPGIAHRPASRA